MLPYFLVAPLWVLVAVVLPMIQTLHALQARSPDRQLWLFYWMCYAAGSWLMCWFEWIIYLPFWLLRFIYIDIYYEVQVCVALYLVSPSTLGVRRLQAVVMAALRKALLLLAAPFFKMLLQLAEPLFGLSLDAVGKVGTGAAGTQRKEGGEDRPGKYYIICPTGVTSSQEPSQKTIITELAPGTAINVLEIVPDEQGKRIRALIETPRGWISLYNRETGKRWARHHEDCEPQGGLFQDGVMAAAITAGCDPTALFRGGGETSAKGAESVTLDEAWEAMAMLESQLGRADDFSEDAGTRQASGMLRQMLATLVQGASPEPMLAMATAMVPDLGKIWAHDSTREYLRSLLSASSAQGASSSSAGAGSGSAGSATTGSTGAGSGSTGSAATGSTGAGPTAGSAAPGPAAAGSADDLASTSSASTLPVANGPATVLSNGN